MKKVLISVLTLIFIVSMITTVYAATASISLKASTNTVLRGKTFTVTVAGTADNNITGLESKISYDTSKLSIESKSAGANFSDLSGTGEIAITSTNSENLSKTGTLYTLTFKVLDNAEVGETTISVTDATVALINESSEQVDVPVENKSVTINIKADDTTVGNQNKEENKVEDKEEVKEEVKKPSNTSGSNNKSNTSSKPSTSTKKNTTNKTTRLPQTGVESFSVIAIIALGAISIASYVSYRKYKNI